MNDLRDVLDASPRLFPYSLDLMGDGVSFVNLERSDYRSASFLDARILSPQMTLRAEPWRRVSESIGAAGLRETCGYIFHIGHVGSTLLSRLIGVHPSVFSLREPMLLRTLSQFEPERLPRAWSDGGFECRFGGCLKLLSRTFDREQTAVVKATSFVSELANQLMLRESLPKAVMLYVCAESYIATIFGGINSRREATLLTATRVRRLHRRLKSEPWDAAALSEGESLALGWVCEMSALAQAVASGGERALRLNFDRFLAAPAPHLFSALRHFDGQATEKDAITILAGPDMYRYSKAPEHTYDAALRRDVLNEARAQHHTEIKRGLAWIDRAAEQFAIVRMALAFGES
jgi:hypothetical protein